MPCPRRMPGDADNAGVDSSSERHSVAVAGRGRYLAGRPCEVDVPSSGVGAYVVTDGAIRSITRCLSRPNCHDCAHCGPVGTADGHRCDRSAAPAPADLARVWMSLHHLSGGRVVLGLGAGERENTEPIGLTLDAPVGRLEDAIVAIRAAWASSGEPLTHSSKFHQWKDAVFALPNRRGTTPPIWVAAQGPRACRVAGRRGDGWIFMVTSGFDAWLASAKQVVAGAEAAGRNPESVVRSVIVNPLLARSQRSAEEMARQPMVQAAAMMYPGKVWAAAGAAHPLGPDFAGVSELDPVELSAERLAAHGRQITAELIRKLFLLGTAEEVVSALRQYVDHGVNHFIIYSYAYALKPSVAAGYLVEQRRLIRLLKKLEARGLVTN